jgi:hypothetical protein
MYVQLIERQTWRQAQSQLAGSWGGHCSATTVHLIYLHLPHVLSPLLTSPTSPPQCRQRARHCLAPSLNTPPDPIQGSPTTVPFPFAYLTSAATPSTFPPPQRSPAPSQPTPLPRTTGLPSLSSPTPAPSPLGAVQGGPTSLDAPHSAPLLTYCQERRR